MVPCFRYSGETSSQDTLQPMRRADSKKKHNDDDFGDDLPLPPE